MHPSSPPRIDPLLSLLARHEVRFVLTGSVALMAMGVVFRTRLGDFDVVPELVGTYEHLMVRSVAVEAFGRKLWIPHVDDLLGRITVSRRKKDVARVKALREIQRNQATTSDFGTSDP